MLANFCSLLRKGAKYQERVPLIHRVGLVSRLDFKFLFLQIIKVAHVSIYIAISS